MFDLKTNAIGLKELTKFYSTLQIMSYQLKIRKWI